MASEVEDQPPLEGALPSRGGSEGSTPTEGALPCDPAGGALPPDGGGGTGSFQETWTGCLDRGPKVPPVSEAQETTELEKKMARRHAQEQTITAGELSGDGTQE